MRLTIKKHFLDNGHIMDTYTPKTQAQKIETLNKVIYILTSDYKNDWIATFEYKNGKYTKIVKSKDNKHIYEIWGEFC